MALAEFTLAFRCRSLERIFRTLFKLAVNLHEAP
jgi:hypothetical protein